MGGIDGDGRVEEFSPPDGTASEPPPEVAGPGGTRI
jgi:hypothetical protein